MSQNEHPIDLDMLRAMVGRTFGEGPSPLGRWLNGTLRAVDQEGMTVEFVVRAEQCNPAQVLHGGIAAAMMDEVVGATVYAFSGGRYHASINLSVDYLLPARPGESVTARSRVVRRGRRLVNAECTLVNDTGELVARATTNLLAVGEG